MNVAAEQQFPAKWPFPPAPPARRSWGLPGWSRSGRGRATPRANFSRQEGAPDAFSGASLGGPVSAAASGPSAGMASQSVSLRQMIVDILLVAMWGAMIPALMWLGAAAGF
ncbi:hypothetical protein [Bordetella flabilis]|uniref:Uncharacterized protein n=1 Tax=Bordetella flabilis TaxID=463014 RepID=A0A193GAV2_9BORD|nr:hypothetical protein [Bordetella flabilis]ANN77127.1 hypothetical protein BAU07_08415 [Bordetella flabilis]